MNILFVADVSISSVIGGAERVLLEQSSRLAQRGHCVHIITRRLPAHSQEQAIINGVKEWRYQVHQQKGAVSFCQNTWQNSKRLFESLQNKFKFDCINFHQPFSAFAIIQTPLSNNLRKVYTCHSLSFEEYISRNVKPKGLAAQTLFLLNVIMRRWIEKRVLKKSNEVITLSKFTKEKLSAIHNISPKKVSVIPGGVDLKRFQPAKDRTNIRRRLKIPPEKVILFAVRNLVPRMGIENLILAMQKVTRSAPDIFLIVGGEGPLRDKLIALSKRCGISDYIRFIGFIPEEKLADYYRTADIFVLPTLELEGFGLVTLEAMASGVPVLGTPVGGTEEIIGKFNPSFLFKDTSPDAMASLITEYYQIIKENPKKWAETSLRCRKFVEEHYSWDKNIDALEKIFYWGRAEDRCQVPGGRFQG